MSINLQAIDIYRTKLEETKVERTITIKLSENINKLDDFNLDTELSTVNCTFNQLFKQLKNENDLFKYDLSIETIKEDSEKSIVKLGELPINDIYSPYFPLLTLIDNSLGNIISESLFLPNVDLVSEDYDEYYEFIGKLFAHSLLYSRDTNFHFAPYLVKLLKSEKMKLNNELKDVNLLLLKYIDVIKENAADIEAFQLKFVYINDLLHICKPIVENGFNIPVKSSNYLDFVDQLVSYYFNQFSRQIGCIKKGFNQIITENIV